MKDRKVEKFNLSEYEIFQLIDKGSKLHRYVRRFKGRMIDSKIAKFIKTIINTPYQLRTKWSAFIDIYDVKQKLIKVLNVSIWSFMMFFTATNLNVHSPSLSNFISFTFLVVLVYYFLPDLLGQIKDKIR